MLLSTLLCLQLSSTLRALTSPGRNAWGADRPSVFGDGDDTYNYSAFADNDVDSHGAKNGQQNVYALAILVFVLIFIVQMGKSILLENGTDNYLVVQSFLLLREKFPKIVRRNNL